MHTCIRFFDKKELIFIQDYNSGSQYNKPNNQPKDLVNELVRFPQVLLIGPNGEQLGIKSKQDALTLAKYAGFYLVLMSENATPAVCKIMDYNKFCYEKQKKLKEAQKKQRETSKEIKEYRLSVTIDVGDFETRRRNAESYLRKGHKIKAFIRFKGRQITHPELGSDVLLRFADALSEVADIETKPQIEGRQIYMMLCPKK